MNREELINEVSAFIQDVTEIPETERIELRRNCGAALNEAGTDACMTFYKCFQKRKIQSSYSSENGLFLVACAVCLYKNVSGSTHICEALKKIEGNNAGVEKKLIRLLEENNEEGTLLYPQLGRLLKRIKKEQPNSKLDFAVLGYDLINWNHDSRFIQKSWIRQFCSANNTKEE